MKLKDARKAGIKYCNDNNCSYACISFDDTYEFTVTDRQQKNTVYFINRNGSLDAYQGTNFASSFHKEYEKRNNGRGNNGKREMAEMCNCVDEE